VILFLLFVELSVARGWISPLFVSRPSNTIIALWQMLTDGALLRVAGTTLYGPSAEDAWTRILRFFEAHLRG